jgi:hypothetical protein
MQAAIFAILLAGSAAAAAEDDVPPPASPGRFAASVLVGAAIVLPAAHHLVDGGCEEGVCVVGTYALGVAAASIGVYVAGTAGDQTGSYAATLGGALLGGLVGFHAASEATDNDDAAAFLLAVPPAIGAGLGVTFTRRYDVQPLALAHGGGLAVGGRF